MLYDYIVKKRIRQTFEHVNNHRWDELLKPVAPHVYHHFAGAHSLAGERHDKKPCAAGLNASAASHRLLRASFDNPHCGNQCRQTFTADNTRIGEQRQQESVRHQTKQLAADEAAEDGSGRHDQYKAAVLGEPTKLRSRL